MRGIYLLRAAAVGLALVLSACGGEALSGEAAKGQDLFNSGGSSGYPCLSCHTVDGADLVGPSLQGISERAGERVEGLSAEEYIRQSIQYPSNYIVENFSDVMPKVYAQTLSQEDIDALVAFLMTQ
jgi:cytochrome c2